MAGMLALLLLLSNVTVMPQAARVYAVEGEAGADGIYAGTANGTGGGFGNGETADGTGTGGGSENGETADGTGTGSDSGSSESADGTDTSDDTGSGESAGSTGAGGDSENGETAGGTDTSGDAEDDENTDDTDDDAENGEDIEGADDGTEASEDEEETVVKDVLSEEEQAAQRALAPENLPDLEVLELPTHYDVSQDIYRPAFYAEESAYDAREEGILTPVRNQSPYGTCWAFATIGTMETSLIKQGADPDTLDLSERHLAYFTYHTGHDVLGNADGDTVTPIGSTSYLMMGGNMNRAALRLMNWQGAAKEDRYQYSNAGGGMADLETESAQDDSWHLRECFFLDTKANDAETIANVKAMIRQYGGVFWSYLHEDACHNGTTHAYYNNTPGRVNHAIMVVGWDDDFPKENFNIPPQNNGAWIVRNSWGSRWGEDGYFYISYEDATLGSGNPASVAIAEDAGNYDNNYFNSNTLAWDWQYGDKMAQVYSLKGPSSDREAVSAVSFMTGSTNKRYVIRIYKNPERTDGVVADPESGEQLAELEGWISYSGVYTVDLGEPVVCNADDTIAVVIYFPDGGYGYINKDLSEEGDIRSHNETHAGESFSCGWESDGWHDMHEKGESLRINLLTDNAEGEAAIEVRTAVTAPKHMADTYKVDLSWNKLFSASGYEIWRADAVDGDYVKLGEGDASTRRYRDEIGQADDAARFYYKIKAVFADGSERYSEPVEVSLSAEIIMDSLRLTYDGGQRIRLAWDVLTGASGYEIERKETAAETWRELVTIEDADCVEYVDDLSGEALGTYQYRIRAYSDGGKYTAWAQQEFAMDLGITQIDYQTLQFTCPSVENASSYYVHFKVGSTAYRWGYNSSGNVSLPYRMTDWYPDYRVGDDYTYYVSVRDDSQSELYRTSAFPFHTVPDALTIETIETVERSDGAENTQDGEKALAVMLTWSGGDGADSVAVYRSEDSEDMGEVYATVPVGEGAYTDYAVEQDKTYYYKLCPTVVNSAGESVAGPMTQTRGISVVSAVYQAEFTSVQPVSDTAIRLVWKENDNAENYRIYRRGENDTDVILVAEVEKGTTSYQDTGLSPGGVYAYRIAVCAEENGVKREGPKSAEVRVRTNPAKVVWQETVLSDTGSEVILRWEAAQGADGYVVERAVNGTDPVQIARLEGHDAVTCTDDGIADLSGSIAYRVRAYLTNADAGVQYGLFSDIRSVAVGMQGIWMEEIPEQVYTGRAVKPDVAVYDAAMRLTLNKDYTVTYKNNVNAGTASVIVKGRGNYGETIESDFVIKSRELDEDMVSASEYLIYNNKEQAVSVTVKDGSKKLSGKKDYTQTILYNGTEVVKAREAGLYQIRITGRGNYTGEVLRECKVVEGKVLLNKASVKLPAASLSYRDGEEVTFEESEILVKIGSKTIPQTETDGTVNYKVSYRNHRNVGTATVVITAGEESGYVGSCSKNFKIVGTAFTAGTIQIDGMVTSAIYTGEPIHQNLTLTAKATGEILREDTDYQVSYTNEVRAGKATVVLTGAGRYSGTIRKTYTISKVKLTAEMIRSQTVTAEQNRAGAAPDIEIAYLGRTLVNGQDYTLSYTNNKNITTEQRKAYITVTGKGNYTGRLKNAVELRISPKSWQSDSITVELPDMKYNSKKGEYKPVPVVCDNGKKLVKNKDYTITYENNKKDDIGVISETGHVARAVITAIGEDYTGVNDNNIRIVEFRIIEKLIGDAKVRLVNPQYFSQDGVMPEQDDLSITHKNVPVAADEYEIVSYSNYQKKGNASLVIRGKGQYGGTKKFTYAIKARGMRLNLAQSVTNVISTLRDKLFGNEN